MSHPQRPAPKKTDDRQPEPSSWRQRYGAHLVLGVFALLFVAMIVAQRLIAARS